MLALGRRGAIRAGRGLIRCEEHLTSLVLLSDEELARVLSSVWLAPLARLRPSQQDIIAETLLAWLQNAGNARLAATQLHVHPQTVRYRLRQIQELFGAALASRPRASTWRSRCAPASCSAARLAPAATVLANSISLFLRAACGGSLQTGPGPIGSTPGTRQTGPHDHLVFLRGPGAVSVRM